MSAYAEKTSSEDGPERPLTIDQDLQAQQCGPAEVTIINVLDRFHCWAAVGLGLAPVVANQHAAFKPIGLYKQINRSRWAS
jgi:hypothetical protein